MSNRTTRRVHFTHHPCIAANPSGETRGARRPGAHSRAGDDTCPQWALCHQAYAAWRAGRSTSFSTDLGSVTCRTCAAEVQRLAVDRTIADEELINIAWLECCRYHGIASPLLADESERRVASIEAAQRVAPLAALADILPVLLMPQGGAYADGECGGDPMRRRVEVVAERLDEALREVARSAIAEYLTAADLADEASRMTARGARLLGDVERRVFAGELTLAYGSWVDSGLARSPARERAQLASGSDTAVRLAAADRTTS